VGQRPLDAKRGTEKQVPARVWFKWQYDFNEKSLAGVVLDELEKRRGFRPSPVDANGTLCVSLRISVASANRPSEKGRSSTI